MEHLLFSETTIESKELEIGSVWLVENLITEANQASASIDIQGHSDWDFPFGSRKSGIKMSVDLRRNTDEKIGMNPSRAIRIPQPHITSTMLRNCNIFDSVSRGVTWHGTIKNESENLVENIRGNNTIKNAEHKNNFEVKKVGHKQTVNWNKTESILDLNQKYSDLINIDPNHTNSIQPMTENLTNIGSVHDSGNICAIKKILASPVNYLLKASPISLFVSASDPSSQLYN